MKRCIGIALLILVLSMTISPTWAQKEPARIEHTTVNGMKVLLQRTDSELTEVTLLLKSGSGLDPKGKQGTALVMNSLVQMKLAASEEEFGNFQVSTYSDYTIITVSTAASDLKLVLQQIKELLTYPLYSYDIIADLLEIYNTEIMAMSVFSKAYMKIDALMYGPNHPYGAEITLDNIKAIRGEDVYRWYRKTYQPGNAILSISGGSKMNVNAVQKFFTPMISETDDQRLLIKSVMPKENKTVDFEDQNSRITTVCMGYPAPRVQDPEYPAFRVLVYYLENFQHYFEELRVKEGLMYAGFVYYSYLEKPKAPNVVFLTMTDRDSIPQVEKKTEQLLESIMKDGIEKSQIAQVVKTIKAEADNKALAGTGVSSRNALSEFLQTRILYEENFFAMLEKVTTEDIKVAAAKYLKHYIRVAYIPNEQAKNLYH